ncbi:MAG: polysaccharide deacetylase family protein [Oscillospiraceae bacterium]|jgi:peptidoglycan/xylan/chitin deacetylase (PgdA/CDA1 family)|nr:polysaccharide deacetylase family protein [Oscillospiraceae bacterium]
MKKFLACFLLTATILGLLAPPAALAAASDPEAGYAAEISIVSVETSGGSAVVRLHAPGTPGEKIGDVFFAAYNGSGRLMHVSERKDALAGTDVYSWPGVDLAVGTTMKAFLWDAAMRPLCEAAASIVTPDLPVLFENGQWASELGEITVHTPGGSSEWAYEDGLIRIYNGVPVSRNIAFRFVFENLVDMRGYDGVVMELEEAPSGFFSGILRFRIDQDAGWGSNSHTDVIRMTSGTSSNGGTGTSAGNWDLERLRGVGGLPAYGESVKIKRIYLEGDGLYDPVTINADARNIMDIIPPRTGNTPVASITSSSQYYGAVEWSPNHSVFQPGIAYTASITLTPKPGWTLDGVPANWFRIYYPTGGAVALSHEAGLGVITHTFPVTKEIVPYPDPTQFVALSFDDVYLSDTEALVDVLEGLGIKGTFFANGINLEKSRTNPVYQQALDRLIAGGHEFGTHLWQHERYDNNADEDVTRENFRRNQAVILELTGTAPRWSRVPYASHGTMSLRVAGEFGLTNLRGLATNDWDFPNSVSRLVNTVLTATGNNSVRDGQIYVCHDQPGQTNTIQAIPEYFHELRSRGVGFMTISELREHRNFTAAPGTNYANFFQNSSTPQIVTITAQPAAPAAENLVQGNISGSLTVSATAAQGATPTYRWYMTTTAVPTVWEPVEGATGAVCAVPTDLTAGTYYFYCVVGASNAPSKTSDVIAVTVSASAAGAPVLPVLFENGQWAPELGEITVHTPRGADGHYMWSYEGGMIRMTNDISGAISRNSIPFRWVFANTIDIRGYDAVVMELEDVPAGPFLGKLRFRIDEDYIAYGAVTSAAVRMTSFTDAQRLRGVGALPSSGEVVKIKKIYLEGDGIIDTPAAISRREIRDVIPPRTGNTPVREITTSPQYTGTVEWSPDHATFQENTVYTATITLTPRPGWTLNGVSANWFRLYDITGNDAANTLTHAAGAAVLTKTFAATTPVIPYPDPTQFVVLSFDDTISPETNDLLDVLDSLGIKANFFTIGINLEKATRDPSYARALARIRDGGHEAGNHTWQHERWTRTSSEIRLSDWTKTQTYMKDLFGKDPTWIRFPYNDQNAAAVADAGSLGLSNLWGFDTNDWSIDRSASYLINRVLVQTGANNMARDGQVYVHHDHYDNQNSTRYALPEIAHYLRSRGIGFMTASELSSRNNVTLVPGATYSNFFPSSRVSVTAQPAAQTYVVQGAIAGSLTVAATVTPSAEPSYQWYMSAEAAPSAWEAVEGATGAAFALPAGLTAGKYYFYCVASAPNAASVTSNVATVTVSLPTMYANF